MSPSAQRQHCYRPDIDGLRAVAVLLVLVFHAFPGILPGGFVGVDIFFVISGYLISSLILADLRANRFRFRDFYARRIRRIFPALILVLAASYLLGWFVLLPGEYRGLGKHIAGGAGFVSNFVLLAESGYFDRAAELKPLLHLWSLGIEEQFYFIWPLLLAGAWGKRLAPPVLILLLLFGSFVWNIVGLPDSSGRIYYLPFTRFWELMLGCLLAYASQSSAQNSLRRWMGGCTRPWFQHTASIAGSVLLALAAVLVHQERNFPGWWALLPTLGAVFLIGAGPAGWCNRVILAHPLAVGIGLVSFPLYLWHWPLLAFPRLVSVDAPSVWLRGGALLLAGLLAYLTYRLIEQPVRFRVRPGRSVPVLCALMAGLLVVGGLTVRFDGIPARMRDKAAYSTFFADWQYTRSHDLATHDRHACNFYDIFARKPKAAIDPDCTAPAPGRLLFLWGDSHAQHLNYGLRRVLPQGVTLLQAGSSGCPPSLTPLDPDPLGTCNRANSFVLERIGELRPDTVILAQSVNHEDTDFDRLAARLHQMGVREVVLIGPVPQWRPDLHKLVLKKYWGRLPERLQEHLVPGVLATDRILRERYQGAQHLRYISLVDYLCNDAGCLTHVQQDPLEGLITYDSGHFTLEGSRFVVAGALAPVLFGSPGLTPVPVEPFLGSASGFRPALQ